MISSKRWRFFSFLIVLALLLVACQPAAPAAEEPAAEAEAPAEEVAEEAPAEEVAEEAPAEEMMDAPTELRVAGVLTTGLDNAWDATFIESFKRVQAESPHGLEIADIDFTEGVWGDAAKNVIREYAKTGNYDIIWTNSAFSDEIAEIHSEFPEILFVTVGSGNRVLGDNTIWIFNHIHECGYLQGIQAGSLTESDVIGIVGTYPAEDVNDVIHGFINGAKSVNPDVQVKITFIESWYDPPKALEAANAQITAGVDQMYMMAEAFEPCEEQDIGCYAKYIDYNFAAPDNIISSAMMYVDPGINFVIDRWYTHKTTGEPYPEETDTVWFTAAEGHCDLSPYHGTADKVPQEVKDLVEETRQKIMDGSFTVELDMSIPESD